LSQACSDVVWSGGFVVRHLLLLLVLAAVVALPRVAYALDTSRTTLVSGPVDTVLGIARLISLGVVVLVGWRAETHPDRSVETWSAAASAVRTYLGREWGRAMLGALIAMALLLLVSLGLELITRLLGVIFDSTSATVTAFALRNLVTIPLTYVVIYALIRPALIAT
jgi:hypothetical protein